MTLSTAFISKVLFPLHEHLKGHTTVQVFEKLEETQWWSMDRLVEFQSMRLQNLIQYAFTHIPYYQKIAKESRIKSQDIRSANDLAKLPLLTKSIIRNNSNALKADNTTKLIRFNTGGSSGEPLIFYMGKERVSHDVAAKWRATRWWGMDIGDPEIVLWGSPIELDAQNRLKKWRDRIFRTHLLPAFEMSQDNLNYFISEIKRIHPKMLFGYPSAISYLASHAQKKGIQVNDLGIEVAFVTSERLYDDQRHRIEMVFGCKVANGYGGRDAGFIAHECPEGKLHITAEDIVIEIIDSEGNIVPTGESGEITVTHLATRDFPFIRYRTGDIGILDNQPCACGRSLPVLKEVQGRTTDFIVAFDGTVMHGLALIYILRDLPEIESFKIIQESKEKTRILIVPNAQYSNTTESAIQKGFKDRLGENVEIVIEQVENILPEHSGKFRYVVSHVAT
ncbi:phenylacetate--CoA ligase family protein [Candidatus Nitrosacidococcus tergens]|uniref:Capsular polysaccharide biosynthesis protein CapK n=1 Tax=Candidatus Nitrosacidococcus tergens TaxID=553981 RepID=A0A7G1QAV9_9GAMM|nr:AMP-binding protein [Candidatus Nitrosacidococcus tergens]CAB1276763.1 Capsular polysaccharide biosynthesis protein CapK [Candidatus Nitrosacidococcus tergens]